MITDNNWTEWSTIQGVVLQVNSKLREREVWGRFEITSTLLPELYYTQSKYWLIILILWQISKLKKSLENLLWVKKSVAHFVLKKLC